ncbi:MAG: hypothetical protein ACFFER_15865 [Candidatus Thorarchaeota archaeon]
MGRTVRVGYEFSVGPSGESYNEVELKVHVYDNELSERLSLNPPFWSVRRGSNERFFQDYKEAEYEFSGRYALIRYTVGESCGTHGHDEAMYDTVTKELTCMTCGKVWRGEKQ